MIKFLSLEVFMLLLETNLLFFYSIFSVNANFFLINVILAGDCNVVLNDTLDKDGGPPHVNKNSKKKVKFYLDLFNLKDVFRDFNPSKKNIYTNSNSALHGDTIGCFFSI